MQHCWMAQKTLKSVAGAGNYGEHPGNCNRDLRRICMGDIRFPYMHHARVPCIGPKSKAEVTATSAVLLPHDVLHALAHHLPDDYERMFGVSKCNMFWSNVKAYGPKLHGNPMLEEGCYQDRFVPCWLHGDGVEFQNHDSLLIIDLGGVLGEGPTVDTAIYAASWPSSCRAGTKHGHMHNTWDPLWATLSWSFKAAFEGIFPRADVDGRPWLDGSKQKALAGQPLTPQRHRFIIWNLLGDRDYFPRELQLPAHSSDKFCWSCKADGKTPGLEWNDFRHGSAWMHTLIAEHMASNRIIFAIPGVTSIYCVI